MGKLEEEADLRIVYVIVIVSLSHSKLDMMLCNLLSLVSDASLVVDGGGDRDDVVYILSWSFFVHINYLLSKWPTQMPQMISG